MSSQFQPREIIMIKAHLESLRRNQDNINVNQVVQEINTRTGEMFNNYDVISKSHNYINTLLELIRNPPSSTIFNEFGNSLGAYIFEVHQTNPQHASEIVAICRNPN